MTDYQPLLTAVAVPRLAGTPSHARVRERLKAELSARGFVVMEHHFTGRSLLYRFARAPLAGVNLIGVRPRGRVTTWLVAHYDSKGQPLSMAARLGAATLVALGALELLGLALRGVIGSLHPGLADACLGGAAVIGVLLLAANRVTDGSAGAVDNASGVVAALAVVDAIAPEVGVGVGVILPDAEEYGLVGARALVRERANLFSDTTVVNFDGIDDRGTAIAFIHRPGPAADRVAASLGARRTRWLPVLVDGLVLAGAAREAVTIMHGDWGTARVVHTRRDSAQRLTLAGVRTVVEGVARALTQV